MARRPGFSFPGLPQHLIQRGNNRQIAFFAEADYRFKNEIEQALGRAASPPKRGRPADSTTDQPAGEGGRLT
jgi:hypothetical protein